MMRLAVLFLAIQIGGFIRGAATDVIFPQGVRFNVGVGLPLDKIASFELTITPEGHAPITVEVDPANWIFYADEFGTRLAYIWYMAEDDPLPLFGDVDYEWTITTIDGDTETLGDMFTFTDPRVEWVRSIDPDGNFSISVPRSLPPLINSLSETHALLERNTGTRTDYNLLVYPAGVLPACAADPDDPSKGLMTDANGATFECAPAVEDAILADYHVVRVPEGESAEEYLVNKLVEDAYIPLWNGKEVPAWFSSGLAQFYAPTPKNSLLPPVQQAARSDGLYSLDEMNTEQDTALWQAQAFGMVLYLIDHIAPQGVYELARVNGENFQAVYDRLMDIPLDGLIPAWQQWIFTRAAESVYGITPYQLPTPTFTITPTPSNTFTPTPTPSLTPTMTPTPSVTPRGVITYVAPPSVTPSLTFTPPPPSVTPRPPGSLPTITPTPTALQSFAEQPEARVGAGAFVVLVLAVVLFFLIRSGNRR